VALAIAAAKKLDDKEFIKFIAIMEKFADADKTLERTRKEVVFAAFSKARDSAVQQSIFRPVEGGVKADAQAQLPPPQGKDPHLRPC
jgi:hypothetical protein